MINFTDLFAAIDLLGNPAPWMVVIPGMLIGLIAGAIPGISGSMAMAILLPATLYMDFLSALLLLTGIFTGAGFGCAIPAILMKIPGMPAAVATTFDGFPMTEKGLHSEALGLGLMSSCLASSISYIILLVLVTPIAWSVLKLGPLEMLVISLWGLTLIAAVREESMVRGLLAGLFGILLGTIGTSDAGFERGTLGIPLLLDGIPDVPALMGLFVASQLFEAARSDYIIRDSANRAVSFARILRGMADTFKYPACLIRGSLIGVFIGVVPGVGASVANLVAYSEARRTDPDPESFGKGNPKGVVASESANSSSEGGSMATLLALGIPGGGATAIMFSAFAMHNLVGGPRFIAEHGDIVYAIILGNIAMALLLIPISIPFIYIAGRVVSVPMRFLIPAVLAMTLFGSYSLTGNAAGPVTLFVFALIGWLMQRFRLPVVATVVGLMLGRMVDSEMVRSYQLSGGHISYLLERPLAMVFLLLLVISLTMPWLKRLVRRNARTEGSPS